jgi:hypothetical protein
LFLAPLACSVFAYGKNSGDCFGETNIKNKDIIKVVHNRFLTDNLTAKSRYQIILNLSTKNLTGLINRLKPDANALINLSNSFGQLFTAAG